MSSQTNPISSSSEETSFEEILPVQPMHQGNIRKAWQKKILQEYYPEIFMLMTRGKGGNYASPTDNLMSPCTKKLQAHKKRHYNKSLQFLRLLIIGRNHSSLPVHSLRWPRPSLTRLKGMMRIVLPLPSRWNLVVVWSQLCLLVWVAFVFMYFVMGIRHYNAGETFVKQHRGNSCL
jgi:hypothetical protein